jgi:hypothetical protein
MLHSACNLKLDLRELELRKICDTCHGGSNYLYSLQASHNCTTLSLNDGRQLRLKSRSTASISRAGPRMNDIKESDVLHAKLNSSRSTLVLIHRVSLADRMAKDCSRTRDEHAVRWTRCRPPPSPAPRFASAAKIDTLDAF